MFVQNIFDLQDRREDKGLYRLADKLHYQTREHTVRQQLLFAPGDALNGERLEETERLLRSRVYLNDAWIVITAYHADTNTVDIAVTVRDVWTLNPGLSLGRSGGANQTKVQLEEENLLGLGTTIAISRSHNVDRSSTLVDYSDPNLFGSWWQGVVNYADNSDGRVKAISTILPFYSLDTRAAGGVLVSDGTSVVSRYSDGQIYDQFDELHKQAQAYLGGSHGLIEGWTQRWFTGVRYDETSFQRIPVPTLQPLTLPEDRKFAYPWFGWQAIEDKYVKTENLDLIGRTEDAYLGRTYYAELGYSAPSYGGAGRSWLFQANAVDGLHAGDQRYLFLNAALNGRVDDGAVRNLNLTVGGRYFERQTDRRLLYVSLAATATHHLDGEQQVLLGGDTGLRGYPIRFQSGTSSALLTIEERQYTNWYLFRLWKVGAAVFFDAGRTWGRDFSGAEPLGMLKDIGVGIRFGNNRSGLGNVIHADLSYALGAPPGIRKFQLTLQTLQRF